MKQSEKECGTYTFHDPKIISKPLEVVTVAITVNSDVKPFISKHCKHC